MCIRDRVTIGPTHKYTFNAMTKVRVGGSFRNLKLDCLLYPALSMMVTVSGDDARHASDHDTKGHALCVPSPSRFDMHALSSMHACGSLQFPCMRPFTRALPSISHACSHGLRMPVIRSIRRVCSGFSWVLSQSYSSAVAVVVCIRLCQNPRSTSMRACR